MKRLLLAAALFAGFWLFVGFVILLAWLGCEYPQQTTYGYVGASCFVVGITAWKVAGALVD